MDRITQEKRSWNMSQIRGKNTKPELAVRSALHRLGFRFSLHRSDLPGKPDLVLPKYHAAIFVHGCFWHRHKGCKLAYSPKTKQEFWQQKFSNNVDRDKHNLDALTELGWNPIVIWECEIKKDLSGAIEKIRDMLLNKNSPALPDHKRCMRGRI